jgi:hypothetical protein
MAEATYSPIELSSVSILRDSSALTHRNRLHSNVLIFRNYVRLAAYDQFPRDSARLIITRPLVVIIRILRHS